MASRIGDVLMSTVLEQPRSLPVAHIETFPCLLSDGVHHERVRSWLTAIGVTQNGEWWNIPVNKLAEFEARVQGLVTW